jgi:hypothetical protein
MLPSDTSGGKGGIHLMGASGGHFFEADSGFFRRMFPVKPLLTLIEQDALVFLEDTPPLPNALGPG